MKNDINYCQVCGDSLENCNIDGTNRRRCPGCGKIVFIDPKLAVVVLIEKHDSLLLVKRDIKPHVGRWSFPSGFVDRGEKVEDAAVREVWEETGLDVQIGPLIGLYSHAEDPVVLAVYIAISKRSEPIAGPETQAVCWFPTNKLPSLPFHHDARILADWRSIKAT